MLTSPAWLTRRSSSGARTRTAECAVVARSTGLAGAAAPSPLRAKRDQSIVAGSASGSAGGATSLRSARTRLRSRPASSRGSLAFTGSSLAAFGSSAAGTTGVATNTGASASGARTDSLGRAGAAGAVAAATASAYACASRLRNASKACVIASETACNASMSAALACAIVAEQALDPGLEPVRHLAQAHRAGEPRTALQGVQRAHARRGMARLGRRGEPVAQLRRRAWAAAPAPLPRRWGTVPGRPHRSRRSRRRARRRSRTARARARGLERCRRERLELSDAERVEAAEATEHRGRRLAALVVARRDPRRRAIGRRIGRRGG